MDRNQSKLTLDHPTTYQITVPGLLDAQWIDEDRMFTIITGEDHQGQPTTILTGKMDQAALQGVLRRLYNLGLPLISVIWRRSKG